MKFLKYRSNLKDAIPLMSLILSLTLILVSVGTYIPLSRFLVGLVLYLPTTFLAILIKKRYYWIYLVIVLPLSLLITMFDFTFLISSLIPCLIISFLFSLSISEKLDKYLLNLISCLITSIFIYISLIVARFLYGINVIDVFQDLFVIDQVFLDKYLLFFIVSYSFIISFFNYFVTKLELTKFKLEFSSFKKIELILSILSLILLIPTIILAIFNMSLTLTFTLFNLVISVFLINYNLKEKESLVYLTVGLITLFIGIILYFILNAYLQVETLYCVISLPSLVLSSLSLFLLLKRKVLNKKES